MWTLAGIGLAVAWAAVTLAGLAQLARGRWIDRNARTGR